MNFRAEVTDSVDLLEVHRRDPATFPFLLQSIAGGTQSGRYDLLLGFPEEVLQGPEVLSRLSSEWRATRCAPESGLPFCGGWFLYLGYEAARWIEPSLRLAPSPFGMPDLIAVRCRAAIVRDRLSGCVQLVSEQGPDQINHMRNLLHRSECDEESPIVCGPVVADPEDQFTDGVSRILDYLRAGDLFQANLSRAWRAEVPRGAEASQLYRQLCRANPAPFAGLARLGDSYVLSSSPERLVEVHGRQVQTRPIAGTRPRAQGDDDLTLRRELMGSLKERAEHVMLIDLERNDLGRICVPGSIEVSELMALESYAHVHHIVSNVRGQLREDIGPGEVLAAVFPGGTITGCPKVRAMQILSELEGVGRGPYTGSMGYLSRCGRLDSNILIRTLVMEDGLVTLRAGAGIVADSDPWAELAETRAKARGLLLALGHEPG